MSSSEHSEHKKKHDHKKKGATLPPGVFPDGGLNSRMHGVPGSTPGCTAGAYAKTLDPENLPDITLKTCFPDQFLVAKKWISDVRPKSLQLLLTGFEPAPTIADVVNKWLIRRVGRKCIEGTEEGRKDMEAFCVDVLKRLRKLPTCFIKLYRAVPWSAMGKSAPGLAEFEEETNIVWPTFTSLTKSESRARELFKDEGGILFVVTTDQAHDVTEIASVHQEEGEFMLEPNSCFTITQNKQEDKVFVVEMKQVASMRPIMKEIEDRKHHHRHESGRSSSADPSDSFQAPNSPVQNKTERSATIVTPVLRRVPSLTNSPNARKNSLSVLDSNSSLSTPNSPRAFPRSSSRLTVLQSPRGPARMLNRPAHRVQLSNHQTSMTMWSAARGYIKVLSCNSRGHPVKAFTPDWASGKPKEKPKEETDEGSKEEEPKEEKEGDKDDHDDEKEGKKDKKKKDKKKKKDSDPATSQGNSFDDLSISVEVEDRGDYDDSTRPPVSPTTPGYGTMALYPNAAPDYIIDDRTVDWQTLGGIILHSTRDAPIYVMSLLKQN